MIMSATHIARTANETALINGHTLRFRSWHEANDAWVELMALGVSTVDIRFGLSCSDDGKWYYIKPSN